MLILQIIVAQQYPFIKYLFRRFIRQNIELVSGIDNNCQVLLIQNTVLILLYWFSIHKFIAWITNTGICSSDRIRLPLLALSSFY